MRARPGRDLKPENLLLTGPGPDALLKLADFGYACIVTSPTSARGLCGSPGPVDQ